MNRRRLLRQQIKDAWHDAITDDYRRQRINSERSLQASLWSKLNAILPPQSRRMFIEPTLKATTPALDGKLAHEFRYPDIVICNTREVIGIIEIKYLPRVKPNWKKDLHTFSWIHKHRNQIFIQNIRHRGTVADTHTYAISKHVLYVWAGVHIPTDLEIGQDIDQRLAEHFLELHAQTRDGEHPELK